MPRRQTEGQDEEFAIPPLTTSPITGMIGTISWGGLNKFNTGSRQVISDVEADDLINFIPQLSAFQQVPGPSTVIATLASTVIWNFSDILNGSLFTWYLCSNGHIYQVSTGGTIVDLGAGFATGANQCDIAVWQGTNVLINDFVAQKIYNWNGTTLATVFTAQPEQYIAIYAGRLWMANGLVVTWTNAGTFNSLSGDSGSFIISDGRCNNPVIGMRDFGGSLYLFGSNWMKTINSLNDVGSPPVLTFQQPTLQSQESIINKWSIIEWGSSLYFANLSGFWQLSGATPNKISAPLDGFFQQLTLAGTSFTGAYARINNMECLLWQAQWGGDNNFTVFGYTRNQQWFRITPVTGAGTGVAKFIVGTVSSAITNNQPIVYYNDGTNIYNLFGNPNATVTSTFNSKIWSFYSIIFFDEFIEFAVEFVIFGSSTLQIAELDSNGILSGPGGNSALGIPPAAGNFSYSPNSGQWENAVGTLGNWVGTSGGATFVQTANSGAGVTATSAAAVFGTNQATGHVNIVIVSFGSATTGSFTVPSITITDTLANTYTPIGSFEQYTSFTQSTQSLGMQVFVAPQNGSGANTVTVTLGTSQDFFTVAAFDYSNINTTTPVDNFAESTLADGSSNNMSCGPVITTNANDLIFGAFAAFDGGCTPGAGFTQRSSYYTILAEDQPQITVGSYTATGSYLAGFNDGFAGFVIGFQATTSLTNGTWVGSSGHTYILEQAVIPYQERNMGVNLTFTGSGIVLQDMSVLYRKLPTSKG